MAKKSLTLRDFTKGLNTESSPRDVDEQNLTRSVGATIERPGILRPLGKANSQAGAGAYYSFKDDNSNKVVSSAAQDPGHGLYSFGYSFNHGERSAIKKVVSDSVGSGAATSKNTYVEIADSIGTGADEVNFAVGDIVRIYGKTASKELNNRYFEVKDVSSAYKYIYLRKIVDGGYKEFCLTDEAGNRVAQSLIYPNAEIGTSAINSSTTSIDVPDNTTGRNMFFKGDYIMIDQEAMLITAIKLDTSSGAFTVERGALGTVAESHPASSKIYKYTYGPSHSGYGGVEQIEAENDRLFGGSANWASYPSSGGATVNINDTVSGKMHITTNGDDETEGASLGTVYLNGNSDEDYPLTSHRKYRVKAKLDFISGNASGIYSFVIGGSARVIRASTTTSNTTGTPSDGTITDTEQEYYADIWTNDTTSLRIQLEKGTNTEATVFTVDDVSLKEIDSLAASDATKIEDGYIEIVPQRSFTKYIACQNGETINLFADDTENNRNSTTKWFDRIADLKDDFKGGASSDGSDLGLDTLGSDSSTWPNKGIMPTYIFGDNALRISPSNKLGKDDTNYSPRWYGYINRNKMFSDDNGATYLNEWYYDTIGVKRPVAQGDSHSTNEQERYNVGVSTDYGKNNILGIPWGNNWFSQMYLTGNRLERQNPAISVMQDVDFWEVEEDAVEMMSRQIEVDNRDDFNYEMSAGHLMRSKYYDRESATSLSTPAESWRIRRSNYHRVLDKVTEIRVETTYNSGTTVGNIHVDNAKNIIVGAFYVVEDPTIHNIAMVVKAKSIIDDESFEAYLFQEGWGVGSNRTLKVGMNVSRASKTMLTKPNAYPDLCLNNGTGGFNGAYTITQSYGNLQSYPEYGWGLYPWIGLTGWGSLKKANQKSAITLIHNTSETPGSMKSTVTGIVISGTEATVTTQYSHGFSVGDRIQIDGTANLDTALDYGDGDTLIVSVPNSTSFTLESDFYSGKSSETSLTKAFAAEDRRGLPGQITTRDQSLTGTNWIYYQATKAESSTNNSIQSRTTGRDMIIADREYHVTYTCRNFQSYYGGKLRMTVGQTLTELEAAGNPTDEFHDIDCNAYKTMVVIKSPASITEENSALGINIQVVNSAGEMSNNVGSSKPNVGIEQDSSSARAKSFRTLLGDLSLIPRDKKWHSFNWFSGYTYPLTSIAFGWSWTWGIDSDNWGLNAKSYDFYVTYLYDGGGTPQESAPRYLRSKNDIKEGTGLRISTSVCYSSTGDVYDMFNKRIMGARLYFKATDSTESDKLQALLDVDFVKGVRKSTNATFVPWEEDYQMQLEKATYSAGKVSDDNINNWNNYEYASTQSGGPYKRVKPADEGSHEHGYFRFDSPPSVLDYETINSSQPFEKGDFYAQYKTIALLKGKAYIGNFSILPNGLTSSTNKQSFEYYPNGILASEEGCYDKFPFETKWVNMPAENDDSPIVKLESYQDNLIIHKELSTHIMNFSKEEEPSLIASLSTSGIKWPCQSIVTSKGVFWANKYGCFYFDGKSVVDVTSGRISKNPLGWPNNNTNMYYWDIDASNSQLPSLAYDEVNHQLLVVRNSMSTGYENSYIWIYDLKSKSWTSDISDVVSGRFLQSISDATGYRTNFIHEAGKKVIYLDNRKPNGTAYNFTTWKNKLYTATDALGDISVADTRPIEVMTKELDFGNPHTQKRIHQIFVTYRMTKAEAGDDGGGEDDIDIDIDYGTDGGTLNNDFETNEDNNYGGSFSDTGGVWKVATLVPSTAIDCYTFQLKISSGTSKVNHDFEINDITFVYRAKRIRTKVKT